MYRSRRENATDKPACLLDTAGNERGLCGRRNEIAQHRPYRIGGRRDKFTYHLFLFIISSFYYAV
jgi:hypothetical protein